MAYRIDFQATADPAGTLSGKTVYPIQLVYVNSEGTDDYVILHEAGGTPILTYTF
jgi:hypothetical protein